jgi:hypothetical protein
MMYKKSCLFAVSLFLLSAYNGVSAQEKAKIFDKPKLSGYAIGQYQYSGQHEAESNTFSVRMVRLSLDGRILGDFAYKLQGQINGNTSTLGDSPRLVDVYLEWQKLPFLKIKAGQFKRPFTFENPMNPIDQGFMGYSQNVSKLAGFSDRTGEHASNGRDIGLQLQGDVIKTASGRYLLHYQVGVFNGQGINTKDVDNRKDVIGGIWVMPVSGLRIGAFGWNGSYARKGEDGVKSLGKHRYAISGEYVADDWTFRSEYIHSTGYGFTKVYNQSSDVRDDAVNYSSGNKADGFYALAIAPVIKKRLHVKARYDMYRPQAEWGTSKTFYELGIDYVFVKNLQVNLEYAFVNDRSLQRHNYSMIDTQLSFRF